MAQAQNLPARNSVARYYDQNTRRFLNWGGSGQSTAIHRKIWAPGVCNSLDAFEYLNRLVAEWVGPILPRNGRVLDLGCGVGGTSIWLARELKVQAVGVTISAVQASLARKRANELGLDANCQFFQADFLDLPALPPVQAAFAIESFAHAADAEQFFAQVAALLPAGGRLVICDDFLAADTISDPAAKKWIEKFQHGWRLGNLMSVRKTDEIARYTGFRPVATLDLTPYTRTFVKPILTLLSTLTRLPLPSEYWANLTGGTALQVCLRNGWTQYWALAWERV